MHIGAGTSVLFLTSLSIEKDCVVEQSPFSGASGGPGATRLHANTVGEQFGEQF